MPDPLFTAPKIDPSTTDLGDAGRSVGLGGSSFGQAPVAKRGGFDVARALQFFGGLGPNIIAQEGASGRAQAKRQAAERESVIKTADAAIKDQVDIINGMTRDLDKKLITGSVTLDQLGRVFKNAEDAASFVANGAIRSYTAAGIPREVAQTKGQVLGMALERLKLQMDFAQTPKGAGESAGITEGTKDVTKAQIVADAQRQGLVPAAPFEGSGITAQSFNKIIQFGPKIKGGTASPKEQQVYALAYQEATKPRVVGSPQTGFSVIQPTLDPSMFPPPPGQGASPTGGPSGTGRTAGGQTVTPLGGPQVQTPERAGKSSLIERSGSNIDDVFNAILKKDPARPNDPNAFTVDRELIFSMVTDIPLAGKGIPFTQGRTLRTLLENGIQGKLRLETGAVANEAEVQSVLDRFMPSLLDSDNQITTKLLELRKFFDTALEKIDPDLFAKLKGRTDQGGENAPNPPAGEEGAVFSGNDQRGVIFKRPNGTFFLVPK